MKVKIISGLCFIGHWTRERERDRETQRERETERERTVLFSLQGILVAKMVFA